MPPTETTRSPAAVRRLHGAEDVRASVIQLVARAEREVTIFAPLLDPRVFDRAELVEALHRCIVQDRHRTIRILVEDAEQVLRDNPRLIALCRKFSAFLSLRRVGPDHEGIRELFVVQDRSGVLHQDPIDRPDALLRSDSRHDAAALLERFTPMWDQAESAPGLHVTGL